MANGKKRSPLDKRTALDGLLGKLDSQLNSEQQKRVSFNRALRTERLRQDPIMPSGNATLGQRGAGKTMNANPNRNPFTQLNPFSSQILNPKKKPRTKANVDPLTMKPKVAKARLASTARRRQINARRANLLARHKGGNYNNTTDEGGVEAEFDDDDHDDLKVVDEEGYKTMEWTEPDGSITILKFDEDGALIGKEKASEKSKKKTRPTKFQEDLKAKLEAEEDNFKKERLRSHKNWKAKALQAQQARMNQKQSANLTSSIVGIATALPPPQITSAITRAEQQARDRSFRQGMVGGE